MNKLDHRSVARAAYANMINNPPISDHHDYGSRIAICNWWVACERVLEIEAPRITLDSKLRPI